MEPKNILKHLCKNLSEENYIFKQLLKIESLKNTVIINQDIEELKKITEEEKKYLNDIEAKEKERDNLVEALFEKYKINNERVLSVLINNLGDESSEEKSILKKEREELLRNIKELKKINEINNHLLEESIKFFSSIIESFQKADSITYQPKKNSENKKFHLIDQHA